MHRQNSIIFLCIYPSIYVLLLCIYILSSTISTVYGCMHLQSCMYSSINLPFMYLGPLFLLSIYLSNYTFIFMYLTFIELICLSAKDPSGGAWSWSWSGCISGGRITWHMWALWHHRLDGLDVYRGWLETQNKNSLQGMARNFK